mmetsp:Transcript_127323/g.271452  ORF Transcript_127323/g.271452 Transcript_127323/m.271452 type:complete len:231 (-) Transcript_127323:65-757(-)
MVALASGLHRRAIRHCFLYYVVLLRGSRAARVTLKGEVRSLGQASTGADGNATVGGAAEARGDRRGSGVVASESAAIRRLIRDMTPNADGCALDGAMRVGCYADCECSWVEQCYPKSVIKMTGGEKERVNVGACGVAMPMLVVLSAMLFTAMLGCIVSARLYLQWKESCAISEQQVSPRSFGSGVSTSSAVPLSSKRPSGAEGAAEDAAPAAVAVPWPEARGDIVSVPAN